MAKKKIDFLNLDMESVVDNPQNPRKHYNEDQLMELADSIKSYGVVQPITVREIEKGIFEVVAGSRRFRASKLAGVQKIPAVIKDLDDDQALEIALIENIQRADVHPMDEAMSFQKLIERQAYKIEDVAKKFGKSIFFVRQRIKLNDLSEYCQKEFLQGKFNINNAINLAEFQHEIQKEILDIAEDGDTYFFRHGIFNKYKGDLKNTTFSLDDSQLDLKAGACISCHFNTSVASLFDEDGENPRCLNVKCLIEKEKLHFNSEIDKAIDQGVALACSSYEILPFVKDLIKQGHKVYDDYSDFNVIHYPSPIDEELGNYESQKELDEAKEELNDEIAEYYKAISQPRVEQVFSLSGYTKGRYIYIEIKNQEGIEEKKSPANQYKTQIINLQDKEKRAKELDAEKIWERVRKVIEENREVLIHSGKLFAEDQKHLVQALREKMGYSNRKLIDLDNFDLNTAFRLFIIEVLPQGWGSHLTSTNSQAAYDYVKSILPDHISIIEQEQQEATQKRVEKLKLKMQALEAKLS